MPPDTLSRTRFAVALDHEKPYRHVLTYTCTYPLLLFFAYAQVMLEDRGYGYMFKVLEDARSRFALEDYGLSQTSLEQVFLHFATAQHDDEMEREGHFKATAATALRPVGVTRL